MTPKEKAKELIEKFYPYVMMDGYYYEATKEGDIQNAKECALFAVDEILNEFLFDDSDYSNRRYKFYIEVKEQIELL